MIQQEVNILGMDLETSVFYHYAKKMGMQACALLYVSDNKDHDIISSAKTVREARRTALRKITLVAVDTLSKQA